jgi:hypothetical protein
MRDIMSRYQFCSELLKLIDDEEDEELAQWARHIYSYKEAGIGEILYKLSVAGEEGFPSSSRNDLIELCIKLIEGASLENFTSLEDFIAKE